MTDPFQTPREKQMIIELLQMNEERRALKRRVAKLRAFVRDVQMVAAGIGWSQPSLADFCAGRLEADTRAARRRK